MQPGRCGCKISWDPWGREVCGGDAAVLVLPQASAPTGSSGRHRSARIGLAGISGGVCGAEIAQAETLAGSCRAQPAVSRGTVEAVSAVNSSDGVDQAYPRPAAEAGELTGGASRAERTESSLAFVACCPPSAPFEGSGPIHGALIGRASGWMRH